MADMKIFFASAFFVLASGQFLFDIPQFTLPKIDGKFNGYKFQYRQLHRLLLVTTNLHCYLINTKGDLDTVLQNNQETDRIRSEVVAKIESNSDVTKVQVDDIKWDFHDYTAASMCSGQEVYEVDYKYYPATTLPVPTTTTPQALNPQDY